MTKYDARSSSNDESTPLLLKPSSNSGADKAMNQDYDNVGNSELEDGNDNGNRSRSSSTTSEIVIYKEEFYQLIKLAVPLVVTYLLEHFPGMVSIALVGHVNTNVDEDFTTNEYDNLQDTAVMPKTQVYATLALAKGAW